MENGNKNRKGEGPVLFPFSILHSQFSIPI